MAVAAFRSTTKRNCNIGSRDGSREGSNASASTVPHKRGHRRSKSLSDSSPRHVSDSGSGYGGDGRSGPADGGIHLRQSWSRQSSDSESEAEGYSHPRRYQRTSLDFSSLRRDSSRGDGKCKNCCGPKRSPSQLDLSTSQADVVCRDGKAEENEQLDDNQDVQVEEKTIRAVHAQIRISEQTPAIDPLESDPPSGEPDATSLYNAMRAEVRKAIADLKIELEQTIGKEPTSPGSTAGDETSTSCQGSVQTEVLQAVAEIRREFAAKLDQSEKRAQELWAQLAVEERRCLDLVKFVKQILPTCGIQPRHSFPQLVRGPLERQILRKDADKQWVSKTLDEDAKRYFEECVSISGLDADSDSASSSGKPEQRVTGPVVKVIRSSPSSPKAARLVPESSQKPNDVDRGPGSVARSSSDMTLSDSQDGLVLPWLDWETEVDNGPKRSARNDNGHQDASLPTDAPSWGTSQLFATHESTVPKFRGSLAGLETGFSALAIDEASSRHASPGVGGLGTNAKSSDSILPRASIGSFHYRWHRWKHAMKAEEYVVQRIRFRNRIGSGRLHLCGGKRL